MASGKTEKCHCPHHAIAPIFLFLIGLTILLGHLDILSQDIVKIVWPVLIMLIGAQKAFQGFCHCCTKP